MASSLSKNLCRSFLSNPILRPCHISMPFCTKNAPSDETSFDAEDSTVNVDQQPEYSSVPPDSHTSSHSTSQRFSSNRPLENGLDIGIYKAILVGQVGHNPMQKRLKSGRMVTLMSVGTGGIRNNRRPLDNEDPREYANRCAVQWHRISVYPERLGDLAMKHVVPGSILYLEGNLETKIFTDPITGLVRRIREVAIRANGRLVFLGKGDSEQPMQLRGVGYY